MFPVRTVIKFSRLACRFASVECFAWTNLQAINKKNLQILHQQRNIHGTSILLKYNKKASKTEQNESDDEDDDNFKDERDSKIVKAKVNSLRTDLLLKAGLGTARNKIEAIFYESKIRLNGQKVAKKSEQVHIGDEIDVVRGFSQSNPSHIIVSRVMVLAANERDEGLAVTLRRYKSLLIENYTGVNAYKSSES